MPACLILLTATASLKNRWTCCLSAEMCGNSSLIATRVLMSLCSASQTSPMPPLPSSPMTRKFPITSPIMEPPVYHGVTIADTTDDWTAGNELRKGAATDSSCAKMRTMNG